MISTQGRSNCTLVRAGSVAQEMFPALAFETVLLKERKDMMKRWLDIERKLQDPRWKKDQVVLLLLPPVYCLTAPPLWGGFTHETWSLATTLTCSTWLASCHCTRKMSDSLLCSVSCWDFSGSCKFIPSNLISRKYRKKDWE